MFQFFLLLSPSSDVELLSQFSCNFCIFGVRFQDQSFHYWSHKFIDFRGLFWCHVLRHYWAEFTHVKWLIIEHFLSVRLPTLFYITAVKRFLDRFLHFLHQLEIYSGTFFSLLFICFYFVQNFVLLLSAKFSEYAAASTARFLFLRSIPYPFRRTLKEFLLFTERSSELWIILLPIPWTILSLSFLQGHELIHRSHLVSLWFQYIFHVFSLEIMLLKLRSGSFGQVKIEFSDRVWRLNVILVLQRFDIDALGELKSRPGVGDVGESHLGSLLFENSGWILFPAVSTLTRGCWFVIDGFKGLMIIIFVNEWSSISCTVTLNSCKIL